MRNIQVETMENLLRLEQEAISLEEQIEIKNYEDSAELQQSLDNYYLFSDVQETKGNISMYHRITLPIEIGPIFREISKFEFQVNKWRYRPGRLSTTCYRWYTRPTGNFEFNRMPFGLKNAPATFQHIMDGPLKGLNSKICCLFRRYCRIRAHFGRTQ